MLLPREHALGQMLYRPRRSFCATPSPWRWRYVRRPTSNFPLPRSGIDHCNLSSDSRSVDGPSEGLKSPCCTRSALPTSKATSIRPFSADAADAGARSVAAPAAARDELARSSGGESCAATPDPELCLTSRVTPGRNASAERERTRPRTSVLRSARPPDCRNRLADGMLLIPPDLIEASPPVDELADGAEKPAHPRRPARPAT
mmetsp:Transcript_9642/g.24908  ORF Transcript_9642/g.24908 Transcript_9642/m.24908 type:complete len:203 (-) Transcript_9642:783-1391(-)